jgi:3-phenylpropionate/trans-cinnamate dioxygenase ferredoxin reductase subunit
LSRCVIVGASHAAAQLCPALRQQGWEGEIVLVGDEPYLPYHRPPLSKTVLAGGKTVEDIFIRPAAIYEKAQVDLRLGQRVTAVDAQAGNLTLDDGSALSYSKLVLATGASARKLPVPGTELAGVYYLRSIEDVNRIRTRVAPGKRAVIVGGGYIGLEAAAAMRGVGMEVTVLEALPRVLQRVTPPAMSDFFQRLHAEEGVDIRTGVALEAIEGDDEVSGVRCADGSVFAADLVVIGIGVIPRTELAEAAGLDVDNGIVVNEYVESSVPDILAVGDCSNHFNPIYQRRIRLESVQNATDQAKVAAATIAGKREAYNALPWFWSDQYNVKLQIAGLSQGYDQVVTRGDSEAGRSFATFYYAEGKLIACDAVNRAVEFMSTKRLLSAAKSLPPEILADDSNDLKALVAAEL